MPFSILLNWLLGLIILLAGFRCHTAWKVRVEGVWGGASGGGGRRGTGQVQRLSGVEVAFIPRCVSSTFVSLWPHIRRLSTWVRQSLTWIFSVCVLLWNILDALQQSASLLGAARCNRQTGGQWGACLEKKEAQSDMEANKNPSVCFCMMLKTITVSYF